MSRRDEKLLDVDREVRRLQARCLTSGYSAAQVERSASCFLQAARRGRLEAWVRRAMWVAGVGVLLCWLLLQFQTPRGLLLFLSRSAQIKTLAVVDWTEVYHTNCLLTNPLYSPPGHLSLHHCQVCEAVKHVQQLHSVSGQEVLDNFLQRDLPLLMMLQQPGEGKDEEEEKGGERVEEGRQGWGDLGLTTPRHLAELFDNNEVLKSSAGCAFSSNLSPQYGGHRSFLHALLARNLSHYYAHWENCEGRAAKVLRKVFRRPEFLPPAVQMAPSSWIFLSKDYTASIFKQVEVNQPLVLWIQVSGQVRVKLEAWRPCTDLCPSLHLTLHPGHVLAITDFLWKLSYLPSSDGESLAVGLGGSF